MYEPGKIMKCGGGSTPPVATTVTVDLNNADPNNPPAWLFAGNMNVARQDHNLVTLPDGRILAVGGTGENGSVYAAEMYDPASATWTVMASSFPEISRGYHSTAVLLPDGRVVVAGGDDEPTAQIYKPPYITANVPRPIILSAPSTMQYGQQYTVMYNPNGGAKVTNVCLIRLGSVTHGFDQDQRRVPLTIETYLGTEAEPGLVVSAPANGNIAPPGHYMLFIQYEYGRNKFAPCTMAAYVKVGP